MNIWIKRFVVVSAAWVFAGTAASGQDVGALHNGNWNDPTIWTTGTVPGSSNNVYIGSTFPAGSAAIATVTLTQNQSAGNLTLGDGAGTSGTVNLGSNTLTVANSLTIGLNGGLGSITEGAGGSFTASTVNVESSNSFTFGSKDVTGTLFVYSGSTATTSATGNVTGYVNVLSGSTLNLGADLSLSGTNPPALDVENTGSVVNMNGHNITAPSIYLGQFGDQPVTLNRGSTPGSLTTGTLFIAQNTLNLIASDSIGALNLDNNATVTTAATGNVTGSAMIDSGSTLNLGANLNLSNGFIDLENIGSSINAHGFAITTSSLQLGLFDPGATTVTDAGTLTLGSLYLNNGSTLTAHGGDSVSSLLSLTNGAVLTVQQVGGIGLTLARRRRA